MRRKLPSSKCLSLQLAMWSFLRPARWWLASCLELKFSTLLSSLSVSSLTYAVNQY